MGLLCAEASHVDYIARSLSVAAFLVSLAVGVVAYLQWRLAREKLRLDLFDRRWQIYEATSKFVNAINNDAEHVFAYLNDFNAGTAHAEFLFDNKVLDYITLVRSHAVDMQTAHTLFESERKDEAARVRNIKKFESDRKWLIAQVQSGGAMHKTFAPYLGFANVKA